MSWLSKKIIIGQLRNYFYIEDDKNVEVSLLSKQQIRCTNLILKTQAKINKPTMPIHIKYLSIGLLEISFDSKKASKKPLNLKLDRLKVILKFNQNRSTQKKPQAQSKQKRPVLDQFYRAVGTEQQYKQRSFLQQQFYQLKQLITEYALGELYLQITNIDVSVEYSDQLKYFGVEIQEIEAKQELSKGLGESIASSLNQFKCEIKNLGAYFGIKLDQTMMNEIEGKKLDRIIKKYILNKTTLKILCNLGENKIALDNKQIRFDFEDILIHQIISLSKFASKHLSNKPTLRPGQGQKRIIPPIQDSKGRSKLSSKTFEVSEGSLKWWQLVGNSIIEKLNRKQNANILVNTKFKKYLFCLLYRYTHGAHRELQKIVDEYELFKTDMQVLTYNKSVLKKIMEIRQSKNENNLQTETALLLVYLKSVRRGDPQLKNLNLKPINYKQIKNSNIIINYQNCRKYIRRKQIQNYNTFTGHVHLNRFCFNLIRHKMYPSFKTDMCSQSPASYLLKRNQYLQYYCNQSLLHEMDLEGIQPLVLTPRSGNNVNTNTNNPNNLNNANNNNVNNNFKQTESVLSQKIIYAEFIITGFDIDFNSSNIHVKIPFIELNDKQTNTNIARISNLSVEEENMHPQAYAWRLSTQKRLQANLDSVFLQPSHKFAEKMLTFLSYMGGQPEQQAPEEQKNFVSNYLARKIPNHPIFSTYNNTSIEVLIKSVVVSTQVFDRDRNFEINLRGIKYRDPINGRCNFGVQQIFVLRSKIGHALGKNNGGFKKNGNNVVGSNTAASKNTAKEISDQAIILTSTRSFDGFTEKQGIKSVTDLVIPFILIQMSCQDIYYAFNIMNVWMKILNNPYYFPPKAKAKPAKVSRINPTSIDYAKVMKARMGYENSFSFLFEGVQFYMLSDYLHQENNRIMDLLIDMASLRTFKTYSTDRLVFQLRDIFIRNCLSCKGVNKQSLIISVKDQLKFGDQPVLFQKYKKQAASQGRNAKMQRDKQLLLFTDPSYTRNKLVQPFLRFTISSQVSLHAKKSSTKTDLKIVPLYIFYSLEFTEMTQTIIATLQSLSAQTTANYESKNKSDYYGCPFSSSNITPQQQGTTTTDTVEVKDQQDQGELMMAPQFQQINRISGEIMKLNLLAVKNSSVVYTISIAEILIKHKTEPYVQRFFFNANRLIIVDTSEQAGPQPIIIDLKKSEKTGDYPMKGSYTTYKSEIMRYKQKKSAYFNLQMTGAQVNFLKKKILQLVNFTFILLRQVGVLPEPDKQLINKPKPDPNSYPLRYKIQLISTKVRLFRSSLSKQGFKSICNLITVTNFVQQKPENNNNNNNNQNNANDNYAYSQQSIIKGLQTEQSLVDFDNQIIDNFNGNGKYGVNNNGMNNNNSQIFYELGGSSKNQDIEFASFQNQKNTGKVGQVQQKIYIKINKFMIFGVDYWEKQFQDLFDPFIVDRQIEPTLEIPLISIEFFSPEMVLNIPILDGNMLDEDFRVLMRMTEQNLSQSPLLFVDAPRVQTVIRVGFRTTFTVDQINLGINIEQKNITKTSQKFLKKLVVKLDHLTGKNQLWTNNEIYTELSINNLELTTKNDVKIIRRLGDEHFNQLPEIPKSNAYTEINDYPKFREMYSESKILLNNLLDNQTDKFDIFKEQQKQQFGEDQNTTKDNTNTQRICQWIKGMVSKCTKCCKCCKKRPEDSQNNDIFQHILNSNFKNNQQNKMMYEDIHVGDNKFKNRTIPMIYSFNDILDFEYDINWEVVNPKKKQQNMIYLNFVIRPNGQKQMYMQAKKIQVLLENSKGLIGLSQFFARPFSVSDIPEHVRKYAFNNNKPFKMLIEVDDALAEIRALNQQGKMERISVLCDLVYDSENRGDTTIGPGISKMRVESIAKILFMSESFKRPIDLSDSFKLVFLSQNRIPYGQDARNENKQHILLKPHEKQDWNISFFIPAFILKALNRIIMINFIKIQNEDQTTAKLQQQKADPINQAPLNPTTVSKKNEAQLRKLNSLNQNTLRILDGPQQKQQKQPTVKINAVQKKGSLGPLAQPDQNIIKQYKKQQLNKPLIPAVTKQMYMIRGMFISEITFQIESKSQSSFVKSRITDIQYSQLFLNNRNYKRRTQNVIATLNVDYWNLKLGVYEPCIEPWNFRTQYDVYQRDGLSSTNLRVSSQLNSWNTQDYINDLNVNITIALYQIYKELMIVYEQEDFDENQDCIDLTSIDGSDYDTLFRREAKQDNKVFKKQKNFPKKMMKYFTRVFKHEGQNLKKYLRTANKIYFNPPNLRLHLYHSYFDHFRRNKCVTYRTPYRIFNSTNVNLALWFYDPKQNIRWRKALKVFQYYAIPSKIYTSDFLVHISEYNTKQLQKDCCYVSVKYLIQMRAKKSGFKKIDLQSAVWKNIFKYSSVQTEKFVDERDMSIRVGKYSFTAITVFSKHDSKQQQSGQKYDQDLKFYDSYCILQSPIIIDNYTYLDLRLKVNRVNTITIPKNQRVQINQHYNYVVADTVIELDNDSFHEERKIMWEKYGNTEKTVQIQKLQSIKMLITRETISSCLIKFFTEWNISNYTNESFSLKNSEHLLIIDKLSSNSLSNISSKGIDICIVNQVEHTKKIKPNNIADVITLAKKSTNAHLPQLYDAKRTYQRSKCCGCLTATGTIYQQIDFVLNSKQDPIEPTRCQKIQIRYRYLIRNNTGSLITLCQYESNFVIAELPPKSSHELNNPVPLFYYEFLPQIYFFELAVLENDAAQVKVLKSCTFKLDQFPGSTFVIKIKKSQGSVDNLIYQDRYHYLRLEIKKYEQQTLIQVMPADFNDFPIYLDNLTDYQIKVMQNDDQIILKPQNRVPFAWSHLISQDYKLEVSIDGVQSKQTYLFNNKSAFDPIKITDKTKKRKKQIKNLYLKQNCYVVYEYQSISAVCLVILDLFDNKLRIHNKEHNINTEINMNSVEKISPLASKIELTFANKGTLQLMPPSKSIKNWITKLQQCVNQDVVDKIFFTIESYNNSRIFFFRTIGEQQFQSSKQIISISHLNVSLISPQPEQIILLYCGDISYSQIDKQNKLNYKQLELNQSERIITIKKIKVSNQTRDSINPVVLSQIKKSNYPFIQCRLTRQMLHLSKQGKSKKSTEEQLKLKQQEERITHYKQITMFMDEAEVMVQAALFLKMFGLKKSFDYVTNQYAVGAKMSQKDQQLINSNQGYMRQVQLVDIPDQDLQVKKNPQVYINYLQIKPIKMTVSVYLDHNSEQDIQMNIVSILRYIPFGIENAIIQLDSYQFFHVFYDFDELKKQLINYYMRQAKNQIFKNAGSYDMFVPIQLIGGVGNGVKQIFYDPIYQLMRKKEIKAVGKSFAEGVLSFIIFLFGFFFKIINLAFKILALFTFDQQFKTKRQSFRKQIFKSPIEGAVLGAKNFWKVFKSFFINFTHIKRKYSGFLFFGYIYGFLICVLKIIPWAFKLVVSLYDWIYVIGLGLINWGYYQQSAMKARSRPRRTFYHRQIIPYNYLHAFGNQIIRKNQLQQIQNQQIYFVKSILGNDDTNFLILSNYRIVHNYHKLAGMQQIKLYQLNQVTSWLLEKKRQYLMVLNLTIPNVHKILFLFSYNVSKYKLQFSQLTDIVEFLSKLKTQCVKQKLNITFEEGKQIRKQFNKNQFALIEFVDNQMDKIKRDQDYYAMKERERFHKGDKIQRADGPQNNNPGMAPSKIGTNINLDMDYQFFKQKQKSQVSYGKSSRQRKEKPSKSLTIIKSKLNQRQKQKQESNMQQKSKSRDKSKSKGKTKSKK